MASNLNQTPSNAHPESMDFLSHAWCDFAVQALQPELEQGPFVILDNSIKQFESNAISPFMKMDNNVRMDDTDFKPLPPWKSDDVKSLIWMQQAMHPELNYNSYFQKKWLPWKNILPFKNVSVKKWLKEIKQRRKEEGRLRRAEAHAAISVAGVAAALAAIATENSGNDKSSTAKEAAVASAAALVAAQCAKVAEAMGAKREQLGSLIGSAMCGTNASDILTLTAAAATSLKGAATLKARSGCKKRSLNGSAPVLPIEDTNDLDFNFEKYKKILAKGADLTVETPEGKHSVKTVSVILNSEAKVILQITKHNLWKSKKESIVLDLHAELYKNSEADQDANTCYLIGLTTSRGTFKLDMAEDYERYKTWATTINHMLMLSTSFTKYELQFYKS